MKFTAVSLAALVGLASATAVDLTKRDSPINVQITKLGNTKVKATITNSSKKAYNIFHKNSILDSSPVDKLHIQHASEGKPDFHGVRLRMKKNNLSPKSFTQLAAGESKEVEIEMAQLYHITKTGDYNVQAKGALRYAEAGSTKLAATALKYTSNTLSMKVDGTQASKVVKILDRRTQVQDDCTGDRADAIQTALGNCQQLASTGADEALNGSADRFNEYFKTDDQDTRQTVHDRLQAVAQECSSGSDGATATYCTDVGNDCGSDVLAYTQPSDNTIAYCDLFFDDLPALTNQCHDQDQATTMIHEDTHAPGVYSPGTEDNGYGYDRATALDAYDALNNADTYALFTNAIYSGC